MTGLQRRDRLWLWGMKVNALQQTEEYRGLGFAPSTMDTEQAMARTGIANVLMAGGLSLDRATLDSMPSARRIIAKNALHRHGKDGGQLRLEHDGCVAALRDAKRHPLAPLGPFPAFVSRRRGRRTQPAPQCHRHEKRRRPVL